MPRPNRPPPGFFKESESKHPGRRRADAPSSGGGAGGAPVGLEPGVGRGILPPRNPPMPRRPMGPPPGFSNNPESRHPRRGTAADADAPSSRGGAGGGGGARRTGDLVRAFGRCRTLLDDLLGDDDGWVFEAPVDARALGLRDYYTVIADPMDLGTVLHRLERRRYAHPSAFAADVRLTFSNAMSYNNPGDPVYESAVELSGIFEDRWASIEAEMPPAPPTDAERKVGIKDELTGLPVPGQRAAARVLKERGVCLLENKGKVEVNLGRADAATLDELGQLVANYGADDADVGAPCRIHQCRGQTDGPIPKRKRIHEGFQTDKPSLKRKK